MATGLPAWRLLTVGLRGRLTVLVVWTMTVSVAKMVAVMVWGTSLSTVMETTTVLVDSTVEYSVSVLDGYDCQPIHAAPDWAFMACDKLTWQVA
jgi:hypothetical protein